MDIQKIKREGAPRFPRRITTVCAPSSNELYVLFALATSAFAFAWGAVAVVKALLA